MTSKYIDVDGRWGIIVIYDYNIMDWDDMRAVMRTFGMREKDVRKAIRVLSESNTGMCVSRDDIRMSCIFVSHATTESEWWSTLNHELLHAGVAIIDYYGERYNEEPAAYLQGYLMRRAVEELGEPCH